MKKIAIVYNPVSGKGRGQQVCDEVCAMLNKRGIAYSLYCSPAPGKAAACAEKAVSEGAERIVVLGGDGSIRETAGVLIGTETELALIPCGSGNDLCRTLGIPADPAEALDIALNGTVRRMDTATANGLPYLNVAGCGMDVDVLVNERRFHNISKNGSVAYYLGLFVTLARLPMREAKITWPEGELKGRMLITAAGNGGYFGGGMNITPGADPFDGLLDCCVIHDLKWYQVPAVLVGFLKGTHTRMKNVLCFRTAELTVECTPGSQLELDGEILPGTPVTFRIVPGSINILVKA